MSDRCFVVRDGQFFSMVYGWIRDRAKVWPVCRAAARIIQEENPGSVIVEVVDGGGR